MAYGRAIVESDDGEDLFVVGVTLSFGSTDGFCLKIDSASGDLQWAQRFGSSGTEDLYAVIAVNENEIIAAGYGDAFPIKSGEEIALAKLSAVNETQDCSWMQSVTESFTQANATFDSSSTIPSVTPLTISPGDVVVVQTTLVEATANVLTWCEYDAPTASPTRAPSAQPVPFFVSSPSPTASTPAPTPQPTRTGPRVINNAPEVSDEEGASGATVAAVILAVLLLFALAALAFLFYRYKLLLEHSSSGGGVARSHPSQQQPSTYAPAPAHASTYAPASPLNAAPSSKSSGGGGGTSPRSRHVSSGSPRGRKSSRGHLKHHRRSAHYDSAAVQQQRQPQAYTPASPQQQEHYVAPDSQIGGVTSNSSGGAPISTSSTPSPAAIAAATATNNIYGELTLRDVVKETDEK